MEGSAWRSSRNSTLASLPFIVEALLLCRRTSARGNHKFRVIRFSELIDPSGPGDQLRMKVFEVSHLEIQF